MKLFAVTALTLFVSVSAFAMNDDSNSDLSTDPSTTSSITPSGTVVEGKPEVAGDLRAPSPKILDQNRRGYFELGVGPAYGAALKNDSFMYNVAGSYNFNVSNYWTLKGLADLYLASGSVSSRLYNFGVGAEYYFSDVTVFDATPYAAADVGLGFARNAAEETATGLGLGVGTGFKFQARELNFDINAHYEQLTAEVGNQAPALFALRGSVMF
jgi:hypothetical protein